MNNQIFSEQFLQSTLDGLEKIGQNFQNPFPVEASTGKDKLF